MSKDATYTILKGTLENFLKLQEFNEKLFRAEHNNGHDDALLLTWPYTDEAEEYFRKALSDPKQAVFFVEYKGNLVGYLTVSAYKKHRYRKVHTGELENMFIEEEHRRRGAGRVLVEAMKEWLKIQGVDRVYVASYGKNAAAISFYKALGFETWEIGFEMKL